MKTLHKTVSLLLVLMLVMVLLVTGCGTRPAGNNTASSHQVTVQVLDVGQGDAILIRTPEQVVLVDTGDVPAREKLIAVLKKQGITKIDKVFITHPHADHLGGMAAIMDNFQIGQIFDSGQSTTTSLYRQYMTTVQKKKIPFSVVNSGSQIDLGGGAVLKIIAPEKPFLTESELNNNSIVAKLTFGSFSMLLTGDAEKEAEARMVKTYGGELKSTVLKAGHHGSNTSSSLQFLKLVAPEAVIISLGANNDYHHPHPSTIKKYTEQKIKIYRTDTEGTVTVTSDGQTYNINKEK